MLEGFLVTVQSDRPAGGEGSEAGDGRGVTGSVGVVGQARRVVVVGGEDAQNPAVEIDRAVSAQLVLDGAAGELVGEAEPALVGQEVAGVDRLGEALGDAALFEQPAFGALRHDRGQLHAFTAGGGQLREAGHDRVLHRRGHSVVGTEQLGHVERIAAGQMEDPVCLVRAGELGHGVGDKGPTSNRTTLLAGTVPIVLRRRWSEGIPGSRWVTTNSVGRRSTRRPTKAMTSSVVWSAQWASSMTNTVGRGG